MTSEQNTPPPLQDQLASRALLGTVALGCVAGEAGLQLADHAGGWDTLAVITLSLPLAALLLVLGVEHGQGGLTAWQRYGTATAVLLMIGTVLFNNLTRTGGALTATLTAGHQAVEHQAELKDWMRKATEEADKLNAAADAEAAKGGCRDNCKGLQARAKAAQDKAEGFGRELAAFRIDKAALGFAAAAQALHADAKELATYEPLALPLGLQLVAIFAGSAAFGPSRRRKPDAAREGRTAGRPASPGPAGRPVMIPANHPVIVALRREGVASNQALANRLGESKGEASKKRAEVAHLLQERRIGRRVEVDLKPEVRRALG